MLLKTSKSNKRVSLKGTLFPKLGENFIYILIALTIIIFVLWPILSVILNSIYVDGSFTFSAYHELFDNNSSLLFNSIFVAALSTIFAIAAALFIAFYLTQTNMLGKKFIYLVLLISMISPPFVDSLAFIMLFGKRGLITYRLLHLAINPYGWQGIVLMETLGHIPIAALLIVASLKAIDNNIIEASTDLGAGPLNTLFEIIVPLAKPGIIVAMLISFVSSLSDFGTPIIIGGNFNVLATEAYINVVGTSDLPLASAMSVLLLIPALLFFFFYRYLMKNNKRFSYHSFKNNFTNDSEIKLPIFFKVIIVLVTAFFLMVVLLKFITILIGSFASFDQRKISFTLEYFKNIDSAKIESFKRSIIYSFIAATVGSIIGILLSYMVERNKIKGNKILDFIATLPYMIPGTLFGIGYILAYKDPPLLLIGTSAIVVINCIFKQLPISSKAGSAVLSQINPEIEDAAADMGASTFFVLKDIVFPMMKSAFIVSFINIFSSTMVTIGALIFIVSPGKEVATIQLFSAITQGDLGVGCIIANMIIITTTIVNLTLTKFLKET